MMGKAPAFQFYPNDWARDLEEHPLNIEGAWIRICCKLWWAEPKGKLTRTLEQWAKVLRVDQEIAGNALKYIFEQKIGDVSYNGNGDITVISRRMYNDNKDRELNMLRQRRFKSKHKGNASVTVESQKSNGASSSSSSSSKEDNIVRSVKTKRTISMADDDFIEALKQNPAYKGIDVEREIGKLDAWLLTPRGRGKMRTQQRLVTWLNNAEKPMEVKSGKSW
jgi:hypothetical protein